VLRSRLLFIVLALVLSAGGVKASEKDFDNEAVTLQVELVAKSNPPTLRDISPYREALVVHEYRVRKRVSGNFKGKRVRVAHWAIYDKQKQGITKTKIGYRKTLKLRLFHQFRELEGIYISDTLKIDPDVPLYHDVGQKIVFNKSTKKRYDYRCSLSETMPAFLMLKDQLRLVALGDSRGLEGIRAELFYGKENRTTPVAYNLSVTSAPLEFQEILVKEYLLKLPKLEWVIYQMSPRVLNSGYERSEHRNMLKSSGFEFDRKHADTLWKPSENRAANVYQFASDPYVANCWRERPWGWKSDDDVWDKPKAKKWEGKWKISGERWKLLESIVQKLDGRGIRLLLYLSPIHPVIRDARVVDDDGTTKEGYRDLVRRLEKLEEKYPNLIFVDLLKEGNHGFSPKLFCDLDHLNKAGAKKLTQMLEEIRQRYEKSKR